MAGLLGNPLGTKGDLYLNDFNEYIYNGIYSVDFYNNPNSPSPESYYGFLIVMRNRAAQIFQIAVVSRNVYMRTCKSDGEWTVWKQFQMS